MELNNTKVGDYLLPNLAITEPNGVINKYGYLRLDYLKKHKKNQYMKLLMQDKLTIHLVSVSEECQKRVDFIIENYKKLDGLTGKDKEKEQLEWVKLMNNYKNMAEEIVLHELIHN